MFILKVTSALKKHGIPYAIVGGYAVALHGAVRGTLDIDLITEWSAENFVLIKKGLGDIGLSPRVDIDAEELFVFREKYIEEKNMIAWNFLNLKVPTEQVDVILTLNLEQCSTQSFLIEGKEISVISKKDLILMKSLSARKQDLLDISALQELSDEKN